MSFGALTIVTVTHNSSAVIPAMLTSLDTDAAVLVVDNGSTDDTVAKASSFARVRVIRSDNVGYGRGANLGFREVQTPYVLLVNPDVVFSPGAVARMLDVMVRHPEIGMLGANMFSVDAAGNKSYSKRYQPDAEGLATVEWIVGALMLIRMEALQRVGMFDENIFLFYEETDLCKRFHDAGYRLAIACDAEARHEAGSSSPPSLRVIKIKSWHAAWSKAYYYRKHFSGVLYAKKCITKLTTSVFRIAKALLFCDLRRATQNFYELRGVLAYMRGMTAFEQGVGRLT